MGNFKVNFNRAKLSSEEIAKQENFGEILKKFNQAKAPVYKNPWFWGSAGLASLGLTTVLSLNAFTTKTNADDKIITQTKNELPNDTDCIKTPIIGEDIPFQVFEVDPKKNGKIVLPSGTSIEIEKNSLLALDLNKDVEIQLREFRTKSEAFIAGIPMDYGDDSAFESAGMIEIRGVQNGKEVKIDDAKPISINLVTTQNPETFGFWYLDEQKKTWLPNDSECKTTKKNKSTESEIKPLKLKIASIDGEIFQVDKKIEKLSIPKEEDFKISKNNQQFDLDFDKNEYPELASLKNIVFEVIPSQNYDKNFTKKNWSDIDLSKEGSNYLMTFKNAKENYQVNVRPVLTGKDLKKAEINFDNAVQSYKIEKNSLVEKKDKLIYDKTKREEELNRLFIAEERRNQDNFNASRNSQVAINKVSSEVSQFTNSVDFQTSRWGVFNSDKPINYPKALPMQVALLWVGSQVAKFKQVIVFNKDKNTRYTYGSFSRSVEDFSFHLNANIVIVGIDFEGNLGYAEISKDSKNKDFNKLLFERKGKEESTLTLLQKLLDESADSV